jgi:hypothetical protein
MLWALMTKKKKRSPSFPSAISISKFSVQRTKAGKISSYRQC